MTDQYRPRGFAILPPVVKNLLIINALMFLAQFVAEKSLGIRLESILGLRYPGSMAFQPWQFVTYMFLHGSFWHIFFNMFALWMFGNALENIWGPKRFLIYYFVTGIGAALFHYLVFYIEIYPTLSSLDAIIANPTVPAISDFLTRYPLEISSYSGEIFKEFQDFKEAWEALAYNPDSTKALLEVKNFLVDYREYYLNLPNVIGASGAVFGILLAFGMLFPNTYIYVYFFFPIKAKYFVILFGIMELYLGFTGSQSNIAHFAHLGGMIFGFFLIHYWKKKGRLY